MRRFNINKRNMQIIQYYESTTNYRFLRTFVYTCMLILWLCVIYNTFRYDNINEIKFIKNTHVSTSSNSIHKKHCCYASSYYNMSYHSFDDVKILEFSNKKKINTNYKLNTKTKTKTKTNSKLDDIKSKIKSSNKMNKHKQFDGSVVTVVKYKGKFYIFYDDEY